LKGKKVLILDLQRFLKERIKIKTEAAEKLKDVCLGGDEQVVTKVGSTLTPTQ
jgi:hypothetical protein